MYHLLIELSIPLIQNQSSSNQNSNTNIMLKTCSADEPDKNFGKIDRCSFVKRLQKFSGSPQSSPSLLLGMLLPLQRTVSEF